MLTRLRANIIGWLAVFIALGSLAYAAGLRPNSVKSKHIRDGHARTADVANDTTPNALTGTDFAANSLTGADVNEAALDSTALQSRVSGSCAAGQSIRQVAQNGAVTCQPDAGSATLAAGDGLSLASNTFSIASCPDGRLMKRSAGSWTCATDDNTPSGAAGGDLAGSYPSPTLRPAGGKHYVGAPGEPAFEPGWSNFGGFHHRASFYKDRAGVVHLSGLVSGCHIRGPGSQDLPASRRVQPLRGQHRQRNLQPLLPRRLQQRLRNRRGQRQLDRSLGTGQRRLFLDHPRRHHLARGRLLTQRGSLGRVSATATVRAFVDAFNSEDLDALAAKLTDDVEIQASRGLVEGRDEARKWATRNPTGELHQRLVLDEPRGGWRPRDRHGAPAVVLARGRRDRRRAGDLLRGDDARRADCALGAVRGAR